MCAGPSGPSGAPKIRYLNRHCCIDAAGICPGHPMVSSQSLLASRNRRMRRLFRYGGKHLRRSNTGLIHVESSVDIAS